LGSLQYHKKTGRPVRRSAGKVTLQAGYVDSRVIEEECGEVIESSSEDDEEIIQPLRLRKRKRSVSLEPPPLDDIIRYDEPEGMSDEEEPLRKNDGKGSPVVLQFNVPLGFHGPLVVKLDRALLQRNVDGEAHGFRMEQMKKELQLRTKGSTSRHMRAGNGRKSVGFMDLPAELRNKVYRHLFVNSDFITLPARHLCRSGQFLSTCRLVYSEGCSVLYSENKFLFDRNMNTRGTFWEPNPKEIGYKDVRQFLKSIGPENLAYLRDVKLVLEDARPATTPYLSHDQRRYVNDQHLIDVLRLLSLAKLRRFSLALYGRRSLARSDIKFIGYVQRIKADEVVTEPVHPTTWRYSPKISPSLWPDLRDSMSRKNKLYVKDE